ncbi:mitochondrial import inner membrane translocase subunit Tim23-like [Uloborus diversus]|uniref:mitochondrial import inner membrane translocase subunit Tim23-like n=1 Tax=Uloborus diversus TaxID=327109 RepID=UPI002409A3F2|nr:mitochondrial import inner membrane translocase subunit Tim23-like [Uloborus diversus]
MDRQSGYLNVFPSVDPGMMQYGSNSGVQSISPYLNVDPAFLNQSPEWIFPEGASRLRGRFELAFSQIGGAIMTGAVIGGVQGFHSGWKQMASMEQTLSVKRTQLLNHVLKRGAGVANTLGVVGLMYSGFGVIFSYARGMDDELNTVAAGTATGLLYKSTGGLKKCARGGAIGFGLTALYSLWSSKDRLRQMLDL